MKKILILLIPLLVSVFIYGLAVGVYEIFPYDLLDSVKSIILNEKTVFPHQNMVYENNIDSLLHIQNQDDVGKLRNNLIIKGKKIK